MSLTDFESLTEEEIVDFVGCIADFGDLIVDLVGLIVDFVVEAVDENLEESSDFDYLIN